MSSRLSHAITRRGALAGALMLVGGARALAAAPASSANSWLDYEDRLQARLNDAGGGRFELDLSRALLGEVNGFRKAAGLGAYAWDEGLATCAQAHAADMAARGYFAHEGPEGFNHLARVSLLTRDLCGETAENLAWREFPQSPSTARDFQKLWEDSPGHRKNLLRPAYAHAGYGVVRVGKAYYAAGVYAAVAVRLARPLPLVIDGAPDLQSALAGASPSVQRMSVTAPFQNPVWSATPSQRLPSLEPGAWQLRPMSATGEHRFDVLSGPLFILG